MTLLPLRHPAIRETHLQLPSRPLAAEASRALCAFPRPMQLVSSRLHVPSLRIPLQPTALQLWSAAQGRTNDRGRSQTRSHRYARRPHCHGRRRTRCRPACFRLALRPPCDRDRRRPAGRAPVRAPAPAWCIVQPRIRAFTTVAARCVSHLLPLHSPQRVSPFLLSSHQTIYRSCSCIAMLRYLDFPVNSASALAFRVHVHVHIASYSSRVY